MVELCCAHDAYNLERVGLSNDTVSGALSLIATAYSRSNPTDADRNRGSGHVKFM